MVEHSHLLLVNPEAEIRTLLRNALSAAGFQQVSEASDGATAVAALRAGSIDALITDIPLDGLDGWRLARLVRSGVFQTDADIPIVVVTRSYSDRIAEVTAKEYEINQFVPFDQRGRLPDVMQRLLSGDAAKARGPSLLVIEDNANTVTVVSHVLGSHFQIEAAADGESGLAAWRSRQHDLVLLDVMLPGLSGAEVLAAMLAEKPSQSVVIMTADGTAERAGELIIQGAADFIAKPFRADQLRRVCDIAARREDFLLSNEQFAQQLRALNHEKERALVTLESIGDGVISTDTAGRVEYMNPVAERLTGWRNREARGRRLPEVLQLVNEFTHHPVPDPIHRCLEAGRPLELGPHHLLVHLSGAEIAVDNTVAPINNRDGRIIGVVIVFHDVTEARKLGRQLSYQATHDSLTRLTNRSEFERVLARRLDDARENGSEHVLCYLDLDQFKVVNDTRGHLAGDQLLQELAGVLAERVRKRDVLARLGGDEFGVLLEYCDLERAREIAHGLLDAVSGFRFVWQNEAFSIGVSIGVAAINSDSGSWEEVLATADASCYLAKERGRNRIHVFHQGDGEIVQRHGEMQWVSRITRAFEEERFMLYAQAIVPTDGSEEDGEHYEFLVRMLDEQDHPVPPGFFLPAAERYDLAATIDRWVVGAALHWLEANPERLARLHRCAINLSGKSLGDEHFHEYAGEMFARTRVPPGKVCFEITETAAITNLSKATQFIHRFRELGCHFALDDFGSGMSSFAYLKTLPVDYLKIDGVFVKNIVEDRIDQAMVRSINDIGHTMGLKTIAEFVENGQILERLRQIGVDYAQGYGIAMPCPLDELGEQLSRGRGRAQQTETT